MVEGEEERERERKKESNEEVKESAEIFESDLNAMRIKVIVGETVRLGGR